MDRLDIDIVREEDRQFFRLHPSRHMRLRHAWLCETGDCKDPADATQRWFVIAIQYTDRSVDWGAPFLAHQSDIAADVDDISIHRLQVRLWESEGRIFSSAPIIN